MAARKREAQAGRLVAAVGPFLANESIAGRAGRWQPVCLLKKVAVRAKFSAKVTEPPKLLNSHYWMSQLRYFAYHPLSAPEGQALATIMAVESTNPERHP